MTDQPKPEKDGTPEGYQPPSFIPAQESVRRRRRRPRRGVRAADYGQRRTERRVAASSTARPRRTTASPRTRTVSSAYASSPTGSSPTAARASSPTGSRSTARRSVRPAGHPVQRLRPAGLLRRAAGAQGPEHRQPVLRHRRLRGAGLLPPAAARGGHPRPHGPQARAVRQGHGHCRPGDGLRGDRADPPGDSCSSRVGLADRQRQATGGTGQPSRPPSDGQRRNQPPALASSQSPRRRIMPPTPRPTSAPSRRRGPGRCAAIRS